MTEMQNSHGKDEDRKGSQSSNTTENSDHIQYMLGASGEGGRVCGT